ncbi:MAG: hypothetical protein JO170_33870 [Verrucomicrobia bacterium]|nr:hypothetical protein [Verrucomicrobiota bacterium]
MDIEEKKLTQRQEDTKRGEENSREKAQKAQKKNGTPTRLDTKTGNSQQDREGHKDKGGGNFLEPKTAQKGLGAALFFLRFLRLFAAIFFPSLCVFLPLCEIPTASGVAASESLGFQERGPA